MSALDRQEGGSHYKHFAIQPVEFITRNGIGFLEGCVIKRVCRWKSKDGLQDLRKAVHELELLIEEEQRRLSIEKARQEKVHPQLFPNGDPKWGLSSRTIQPTIAAAGAVLGAHDRSPPSVSLQTAAAWAPTVSDENWNAMGGAR